MNIGTSVHTQEMNRYRRTMWTWCFWKVFGRVGWVLLCGGIFWHVMVGGGGGVAGPKELVGWVDTVTDGMYPPHRSVTVVSLTLPHITGLDVRAT